ncbi:hypothetical protein Y032_0134g1832 [Ancylostoma ceylanicum]|nr:hypothetical protein Y032_0134g1832 [Ancylostoma ceylanicum]
MLRPESYLPELTRVEKASPFRKQGNSDVMRGGQEWRGFKYTSQANQKGIRATGNKSTYLIRVLLKMVWSSCIGASHSSLLIDCVYSYLHIFFTDITVHILV